MRTQPELEVYITVQRADTLFSSMQSKQLHRQTTIEVFLYKNVTFSDVLFSFHSINLECLLCQAERIQIILSINSNNYMCICLPLGDSHIVIQLFNFR